MRVKSAFAGSFVSLLVRSGVAVVLLAVFFIASSFTEHANRDLRAKEVNLLIRQTGHRLLLQAGDSTSRVLPVTEIKDGTFLLRFENEFVFDHDSLMALSQRLLPKKQFPSGYTVTVHDCKRGSIVYGFQISNTSPDILACKGRSQSPGCYTIEFAFPDFYENLKQQKADIDQPVEPVNADTQDVNQKNIKSKVPAFDYSLSSVAYAFIIVLLGIALVIGRPGRFLKPLSGKNQNQAVVKESDPELAALGKFLFNVKGQHLILESEVVSLTDKECKVLELLHRNFGELIPRETLMQEVWINEGVFTGRSLDVFVSKLRKKLSHDPGLRITNVHGKGYKLEMP
ncbi:hypothetical protein GCM10023091_13640 [Ravibacter arvi]|uniref:OmpR/PhoB-type domain-containing protein n=1 Tax=Ravibacter arvi TaxID=2051041 RepID=A0ABP8LTE3_9BACT